MLHIYFDRIVDNTVFIVIFPQCKLFKAHFWAMFSSHDTIKRIKTCTTCHDYSCNWMIVKVFTTTIAHLYTYIHLKYQHTRTQSINTDSHLSFSFVPFLFVLLAECVLLNMCVNEHTIIYRFGHIFLILMMLLLFVCTYNSVEYFAVTFSLSLFLALLFEILLKGLHNQTHRFHMLTIFCLCIWLDFHLREHADGSCPPTRNHELYIQTFSMWLISQTSLIFLYFSFLLTFKCNATHHIRFRNWYYIHVKVSIGYFTCIYQWWKRAHHLISIVMLRHSAKVKTATFFIYVKIRWRVP